MSKVFTIGAPEGTGSSGSSGMKNIEPINDVSHTLEYYPPGVSIGTTGTGKTRIVQARDGTAHQKPLSSNGNCNSSLYSPYDDDGLD